MAKKKKSKVKKKTTQKKSAKKKVAKKKPAKGKKSKTKAVKKKASKKKSVKRKVTKPKKKAKLKKAKKKVKGPVKKKKAAKEKGNQKKIAKRSRADIEYKEIEQMLQKQREELLRMISKSSSWEKDISKLERGGLEDMAATSLEREMTFTMGSREREEFRMINNALKKMIEGTYGQCENCGVRINIARLKIVPFAPYCMECKSSMEQEVESGRSEIY